MNFEVIGFGALNLDQFLRVNRIAGRGEESFILEKKEFPGGSAANTIVGLARLELNVGFIGKIANDREGKILLESFTNEGVNTQGIIVSKEGRTGIVNAFVDGKGERAMYIYPCINDALNFDEISLNYASSSKFLHLSSFVGEKPFKAQESLVLNLPQLKFSLDPGELYVRMGLTKLRKILRRCFIFLPTKSEIELLFNKPYKEAANILIKEGIPIVAVKLGDKGCYVSDGREKYHVPPFKVKVADTIGAGDAFCAGFLYGLIKNKDLYECGRLGNLVAAFSLKKFGARDGLPKLSDVNMNIYDKF